MTIQVIFRAKLRAPDAEFHALGPALRELAMREYGCTQFIAVSEGEDELAVSSWPDMDAVRRWQAEAQHRTAQQLGQDRWYAHYQVDVCTVERSYQWTRDDSA